jgi:hypothetical protein
MNTTFRTLISTAFAAATLCALPAAHAAQWCNGISFQGIQINGLAQNGITFNGMKMNGLRANGLFANGLFANGLFANGWYLNGWYLNGLAATGAQLPSAAAHDTTLPTPQAIVLLDGRSLTLR